MANKIQRVGPVTSIRVAYAYMTFHDDQNQAMTIYAAAGPQADVNRWITHVYAQHAGAQSEQTQHNPGNDPEISEADHG